MSLRPRSIGISLAALLAGPACSGGGGGSPPPGELAIVSFSAAMNPVEAGTTTTLSWSVQGASTVQIQDDLGERIVDGPEQSGSVETPVIEEDRVYTLTALQGNDFARTTLRVEIATDTRPRVARFEAEPSSVVSGESAILRWSTRNTTSVRIEAQGGALVVEEGIDVGMVEISPAETTTYVLTASSPGEPDGMAMTTLTVTPPLIDAFSTTSTVVAVGEFIRFEYETTGADEVRLLQDGVEVAASTEGEGSFSVLVAEGVLDHVLEASNEAGASEQTIEILGVGLPVIELFAVSSVISTLDEPITVSWDVRGVTSLELVAGGDPVPDFPVVDRPDGGPVDASGTLEVSLRNDGIIALRAETIAGVVTESAFIDFFEPLSLDEEPEFVEVVIPAGADVSLPIELDEERYLVAESFSSRTNGTCDIDTVITLQADDGTIIGSDDDDGVDLCSRIDGTDEFARLERGLYRLVAQDKDRDEEIDLDLVLRALPVDVCGNGLLEQGETCDDGNVQAADGCSASCQSEISLSGSGTTTLLGRSIRTGGDFQVDLVVTSTVYIDVQTFENAMMESCPNLNTQLRIFDDLGERVVDFNGGVGNCSRIGPPTPAAVLEPGDYVVQVVEANAFAIPSFDLVLETTIFGVCGNDFRDGSELCDDGNLMDGDFCASNCIPLEGIRQMPGASPEVSFTRLLDQGERSPFVVEVIEPSTLTAQTFSNATTGACNINLTKRLLDQQGNTLLSEGGGCTLFDVDDPEAALDPGTYAIEVVPNFNSSFPIQFEITMGLVPIECGNFIIEQGETCDDGNTVAGDGCDENCIIEPICGDASIDPPELCDDGNTANGDGCSATCVPETVVTGGVGTTQKLSARTVPLSGDDYVQLTTTSTVQLTVETFDDVTAGTCATINTFVELFDDQANSLASDDDGGVNLCSLLDFGPLAPGDYVIRTSDPTISSTFNFEMQIDLTAPPP
jgi:cysteine-rich repeat protein